MFIEKEDFTQRSKTQLAKDARAIAKSKTTEQLFNEISLIDQQIKWAYEKQDEKALGNLDVMRRIRNAAILIKESD